MSATIEGKARTAALYASDGYGAGRCDPHFLDQVSQPAASAVCLALDDRMIGLPGAS